MAGSISIDTDLEEYGLHDSRRSLSDSIEFFDRLGPNGKIYHY